LFTFCFQRWLLPLPTGKLAKPYRPLTQSQEQPHGGQLDALFQ